MPYIIKNGLTYTGNLMPITQARYDDLSEAEKNNGIAYFIVDSDAVLDASDVGLGEGNVEDLAGSVAVIETSPATAIHAVGDFILWDGQLYTVTSAIAVGEDLTVGSNITATSAGSELTSLKSGLDQLNRYYTLTPNAVPSRITHLTGGYKKLGSAIIFNVTFKAVADAVNSPQIYNIMAPRFDTALSCVDITSGMASAIGESIPCGIATTGRVYVQKIVTNHIYALTGVYLTEGTL